MRWAKSFFYYGRCEASTERLPADVLDEEILNKRSGFLTLLAGLYKQRLIRADSLVDGIAAKPFNFSIHETLTVAEDSSYPADRQAIRFPRSISC